MHIKCYRQMFPRMLDTQGHPHKGKLTYINILLTLYSTGGNMSSLETVFLNLAHYLTGKLQPMTFHNVDTPTKIS